MLANETTRDALPLHVLTGFLGSGKTTLLAELLRAPRGERLAVLVNEAGALPIDAHLLERVDDDILALPSGCLCCALRGELHAALGRLAERRPDRILIETSGLADPAPLLHGLAGDRHLASRVRPAGVICVVDALRAEELLDAQPEFRRQLEFADRIVVTKADLAPERVGAVREMLATAAPGCEVRQAAPGKIDPAWLLDATPLARLDQAAEASRWLHHGPGRSGPEVGAHVLELDQPCDVTALQLWLRLTVQLDGPRLLRFKALVRCRESGAAFALQAAGRSVSPPRRLDAPHLKGLSAVMLERGLGPRTMRELLVSLRAAAAGRLRTASRS